LELLTRLVPLICAYSAEVLDQWVEAQEVEVGRHTVAEEEERHVAKVEEEE